MHQIIHLSPVGCFTPARGKTVEKNRDVSGVNDQPNVSKLLSSVLFSDYTTLYAAGSDISSLINMFNDELLCVSRWMNGNVLSLNVSKTFAMMFSKEHNSDAAGIQLLLNGSEIQFERH